MNPQFFTVVCLLGVISKASSRCCLVDLKHLILYFPLPLHLAESVASTRKFKVARKAKCLPDDSRIKKVITKRNSANLLIR